MKNYLLLIFIYFIWRLLKIGNFLTFFPLSIYSYYTYSLRVNKTYYRSFLIIYEYKQFDIQNCNLTVNVKVIWFNEMKITFETLFLQTIYLIYLIYCCYFLRFFFELHFTIISVSRKKLMTKYIEKKINLPWIFVDNRKTRRTNFQSNLSQPIPKDIIINYEIYISIC